MLTVGVAVSGIGGAIARDCRGHDPGGVRAGVLPAAFGKTGSRGSRGRRWRARCARVESAGFRPQHPTKVTMKASDAGRALDRDAVPQRGRDARDRASTRRRATSRAAAWSGEVIIADNGSHRRLPGHRPRPWRPRRRRAGQGLRQRAHGRHRGRPRRVRHHGRRRRQLRLLQARAVRRAAARGRRPRDGQPLPGRHRRGRHAAAAQVPRQPGALRGSAGCCSARRSATSTAACAASTASPSSTWTCRRPAWSSRARSSSSRRSGASRVSEVPTTLDKDGRSRPPHLRSWRDGWRHLRFLLIFSPRWLFLIPGAVAFFLGLLGTLYISFGPDHPRRRRLRRLEPGVPRGAHRGRLSIRALRDPHEDLRPARGLPNTAGRATSTGSSERISLESGALVGLAVFLVGFAIGIWQFVHVGGRAASARSTPRAPCARPSSRPCCMMLGAQTIMAGLFLGILTIPTRADAGPLRSALRDTSGRVNG